MKRLLIITPHLSTGGAPQVTVNKIELLKDEFDIMVVEHAFVAAAYVIQRNRILNLVGQDRFKSLGENKTSELIDIVEEFKPDVISLEEFPEMFMESSMANYIYKTDKTWRIVETTHDSSFNPKHKTCIPDQFIFVSAYNAFKYVDLDVPTEIIEYPVDKKDRNQYQMREKLNLEHDYKHIVIVGLFTIRKNQSYAFDIARQLENYKIKFHFLGNQAGNFESYWKPLMVNKPKNCIIWGERDDVTDFIQASDVFLFPSKGDRGNKELNPIAIKEAMEYDIIKMMYNLDVYCNKYNEQEDVVYLTGDLGSDTTNLITNLNLDKVNDELIIIGTYPNLKERVKLTKDCVLSMKALGRKIMLVSHYPVDQEIQRMVDYYVYDAYNPLTHHSYYTRFYNYTHFYDAQININGLKDTNQSLTVLTNMFNGFKAAKQLGYKRAFYNTYDVIVDSNDIEIINTAFSSDKQAYVATLPTPMGKGIQTNGMLYDVDYFLNTFDDVRDATEYNRICESIGAQNFLEDYLMKRINQENIEIITNDKETLLVNSGLGTSSNSEYYSILPIKDKPNHYVFYFYTYNIDSRIVKARIGNVMVEIDISKNREYKYEFEYTGNTSIALEFYDGNVLYKTEFYEMNPSTIDKYNDTGIFTYKNQKSKIKLVHIQTTNNDEREQLSRASLSGIKDYWEYVLHINKPFKGLPPAYNCIRPNCVSLELFNEEQVQQFGTALTPAHYGCFESFKNAILSEFHDCDFLIVCEGDCIIEGDIQNFVSKIEQCAHLLVPNNVEYMSFGDRSTLEHGWLQSPIVEEIPDQDLMYITNHIIGLQCIMFPKKVSGYLKTQLRSHDWDAADLYFNIIFNGKKMGIVKERLTTQADGFSLIDNMHKSFIKK